MKFERSAREYSELYELIKFTHKNHVEFFMNCEKMYKIVR